MRAKSNYLDPESFAKCLTTIPSLKIRKWKDEDVAMVVFKIPYWCGLRMGESIRLCAEDFNLSEKTIYLGKTKTHKEDYAPIPDIFLPELGQYLLGKEGQLLPKCNYYTVYHWLKQLGKMLDIPALTTHQSITGEKTVTHIFRKSIGKDMLYGIHGPKAPLNIVAKQLRHNDLVTTSKYLKVGIEDVKDWWQSAGSSKEQSHQ